MSKRFRVWLSFKLWRRLVVGFTRDDQHKAVVQIKPRVIARIFNSVDTWQYLYARNYNSKGLVSWISQPSQQMMLFPGDYIHSVLEKEHAKESKRRDAYPDPSPYVLPYPTIDVDAEREAN